MQIKREIRVLKTASKYRSHQLAFWNQFTTFTQKMREDTGSDPVCQGKGKENLFEWCNSGNGRTASRGNNSTVARQTNKWKLRWLIERQEQRRIICTTAMNFANFAKSSYPIERFHFLIPLYSPLVRRLITESKLLSLDFNFSSRLPPFLPSFLSPFSLFFSIGRKWIKSIRVVGK